MSSITRTIPVNIGIRLVLLIITMVGLGYFLYHLGHNYWQLTQRYHRRFTSPPTQFTPVKSAPPVTPTPNLTIELMSWLAWWDQPQTIHSLDLNHQYLTTISPSWYHLNETGQILPLPTFDDKAIYQIATQSGLLIMPTIGNDLDQEKITTFLSDPDNFNPAIDYLISTAINHRYSGFDIDFESIPNEFTDSYTQFLALLADKLHQSQLLLSVAVHARTGQDSDWHLAVSHDYQAIGRIADQVRIMAYDFHYSNSPAGPVTPIDQLDAVITYALQTIPPKKIVLGLPLYGYDWPENSTGISVTYADVQKRIALYPTETERDANTQSLISRYDLNGQEHTIWYEDAQSTLYKVQYALSKGISRFIFWRLGDEDPTTLPSIASAITIIRLNK